MKTHVRVGFLLYPNVTQLDLTGPAQFLSRMSETSLHFVWKTKEAVTTDAGFSIVPTDDLQSCPDLDILCVPGGGGQVSLMHDEDVLAWLCRQAACARYVTSVCSGSLLLGAAGLIGGYQAACHWRYREQLRKFGAEPIDARIVRDRNRITGGGVTAGIDFALALIAELRGEEEAKAIQLAYEYAPEPPFDSGSPRSASAATLARALELLDATLKSERGR